MRVLIIFQEVENFGGRIWRGKVWRIRILLAGDEMRNDWNGEMVRQGECSRGSSDRPIMIS